MPDRFDFHKVTAERADELTMRTGGAFARTLVRQGVFPVPAEARAAAFPGALGQLQCGPMVPRWSVDDRAEPARAGRRVRPLHFFSHSIRERSAMRRFFSLRDCQLLAADGRGLGRSAQTLPTDPALVTGQLDNGLRYIVRAARQPARAGHHLAAHPFRIAQRNRPPTRAWRTTWSTWRSTAPRISRPARSCRSFNRWA